MGTDPAEDGDLEENKDAARQTTYDEQADHDLRDEGAQPKYADHDLHDEAAEPKYADHDLHNEEAEPQYVDHDLHDEGAEPEYATNEATERENAQSRTEAYEQENNAQERNENDLEEAERTRPDTRQTEQSREEDAPDENVDLTTRSQDENGEDADLPTGQQDDDDTRESGAQPTRDILPNMPPNNFGQKNVRNETGRSAVYTGRLTAFEEVSHRCRTLETDLTHANDDNRVLRRVRTIQVQPRFSGRVCTRLLYTGYGVGENEIQLWYSRYKCTHGSIP
ncbi:unnamed protein product [Sphagnum balticum]